LIKFITPCWNDTLYYYFGKSCTCEFTTSCCKYLRWRGNPV